MTIEFRSTYNKSIIKQWPNWNGPIPMPGDEVILHWGDNNEESEVLIVKNRVISGTESGKLIVVVY